MNCFDRAQATSRTGKVWRRASSRQGKLALLGCTCLTAAALVAPSSAGAQTAPKPLPASDRNVTVLQQLVVTASGFEQNVKDAPASITVVSREELEKGTYRDLTDALRDVQGVAVTGPANERDIFIRGLPGQYTLILVDGKRQSTREARTNGNSGFEQSFMPPLSAIERIEVVRGPMSSLYGSDAMGGVINIITRKVGETWSGSFTADGTVQQRSEFGNSGQGSFYLNGPVVTDALGLQVWGKGLKREEDGFLGGISGAKEGTLGGSLTFVPSENHEFRLEGGTSRIKRDANAGQTLAPNGTSTYNDNDRDHWSLTHVGDWGWTKSEFSVSQEWAERTNFNWDKTRRGYVEQLRSPEIRNSVIDGKFTTPFELLGSHTLVTGGQFFDALLTDQNPGRRTGRDEQFQIAQWALFAEDEWKISDTFALTGGMRLDNHQEYGSHFSPRLYGVWNPTDHLTLKGGLSTGFRAPDVRSIAPGYAYTTGGSGCSYVNGTCGVIIADPNLKAETSTSYELGALWDSHDGITLGATYFYTDFKDKIGNAPVLDGDGKPVRWKEDPNYQLWYNFNIDDAVIQGVELTATWDATDTISLRGSYTYTHSEQQTGKFAGFPLARTPAHIANIRADWETPVDGLSAWAAANYHGSEINAGPRVSTIGKPVVRNGVTGRKYDAYATVDIGATYAFSESFVMNAAVYNLLDEKVVTSEHNAVMEGRRFWLSMTSNF